MDPPDLPTRAGKFFRSLLPAQPADWLLLLGSTCLFIAQHLRWWPVRGALGHGIWPAIASAMCFPFVFAGAAGYYVALLPCQKPVRRILLTVLLPSLVSLLAIPAVGLIRYSDNLGLENIVLDSVFRTGGDYWRAIPQLLVNLGPGLQYAATGFLLVTVFTFLVSRGQATLPVSLAADSLRGTSGDFEEGDRRTARFVWMMVGLVPLAAILIGIEVIIVFLLDWLQHVNLTFAVESIGSALPIFLLVLLALGKDRRAVLHQLLRRFEMRYVGLSILIPAAIASVWPGISYLRERIDWAQEGLGRYGFPPLERYFALPQAAYLLLFVPALAEEIGWRGYLQPRLVRKYGLARGIFLVGIVWGAFHFYFDSHSRETAGEVPIEIARRLLEAIAQSYVLGWLVIRSRSILPAAIAHAVFNMFLMPGIPVYTPIWLSIGLWAAVAYVLFRYFPPQRLVDDSHLVSPPMKEPAQPGYNETGG